MIRNTNERTLQFDFIAGALSVDYMKQYISDGDDIQSGSDLEKLLYNPYLQQIVIDNLNI